MEESTKNDPSPKSSEPIDNIKKKKQQFENIVKEYLESNPIIRKGRAQNELEIRFGTNTKLAKPLSKIDYDNVVKYLYACGFQPENPDGTQILRVIPETIDIKTGKPKMQIRAEIVGADLIQEYCRTNSIQSILNMPSTLFNKIKFTRKSTATTQQGEYIQKLDMDDFNFRVSFQIEQDYNTQSDLIRSIINRWADSKKIFRSMNRVRFHHPDYPIFADLSIVKSSATTRNRIPIPQYTVQDANVFQNIEKYEIELEIDNTKVGLGTPYNTTKQLMAAMRKCIRIILSGLQGTKYPISYQEQSDILQEYMAVVHGDLLETTSNNDPKIAPPRTEKEILDEIKQNPRKITTSDFIGPSSFTLQIGNIIPPNEKYTMPNIREHFTVTDKADGERRLLYVSGEGNIYMIDTNMNVINTGAKTTEKSLFYSVLDGEHIKHDRNGRYLNLYAAFDLYFVHKKSVRELAFHPEFEQEKEDALKFRLPLLQKFIEVLKPHSIFEEKGEVTPTENKHTTDFTVKCKTFKATSISESIQQTDATPTTPAIITKTPQKTIFECCSEIMSNIQDGTYEYNTDGLIFTPSNLAVGATVINGPPSKLSKITWSHSFKWKPPEFNTIDFLVTVKKDKTGRDEVHHIFQDGHDMQGTQQVLQYKTMVLHVGFNPREDGYINPFQDVLNDNIEHFKDQSEIDDAGRILNMNASRYKPVPFVPTNPYDPNACFANILLKDDGARLLMSTEDGDYFEEDMIVEFKYIPENEDGWRWVPIRVRYDKTAQLRSKKNNFGNAYKVANNNWYSIHHPITPEMITSGKNIPETTTDDDQYYVKSNVETSTRSLRDFHNLYVKKNLIEGVANRNDTLIDLAVGKAGDLKKWIKSNLSFVFGIDYSRDNIINQLDGACARYLNEAKKTQNIMKALFVQGDSGLNIRSGQAFMTEKDKQVARAVFGQGAKDITELGKGVYQQYGVGEQGFNICSCQFALHYFFKNSRTLHQFLRNITECTKIGGHFIGTCYDGETVFQLLRSYKKDEGITIQKNDRKIFEIIKKYDETGFPEDDAGLGYAIHVYQESINQYIQEYLVNFPYFIRMMEDYGFILVTKDDARHMNMPDSTGMFSELFNIMDTEIKRNPNQEANYRSALYMSLEEKRISFMNRYFIFKKVRSVDAKKLEEVILKEQRVQEETAEETMKDIQEYVEQREEAVQTAETPIVKKKRRFVLKKPVEAAPASIPVTNIEQVQAPVKKRLVIKPKEPEPLEPTPAKKRLVIRPKNP
jgi:mRNA capping enzyme